MEVTCKSFHLRWNNHLDNLRVLVASLFNEQILCDVTIACQDGSLKAHKLILTACSPFFEQIFRENPCKHPTIIMKDVAYNDIYSLCQYMYVGSVDIEENELSPFLKAARELKIKGLDEQDISSIEQFKPKPTCDSNVMNKTSGQDPNIKYQMTYGGANLTEADSKAHLVPCKDNSSDNDALFEQENLVSPQVMMGEHTDEANPKTLAQLTQIDFEAFIESHTKVNLPPSFECPTCQRTFLSKTNLRRHMQTHSGLKPHHCSFCDLSFLRLSHLQRHLRTHTGERPFTCSECSKKYSRSDKLRYHIMRQHPMGQLPVTNQAKRGRPKKINLPTSDVNVTMVANIQNLEELTPVQGTQEPLNLAHYISPPPS